MGRWSFLALGIMYGISRHRSLVKKETKLREIEERERPAREAKKAAEKARLNRGTLHTLMILFMKIRVEKVGYCLMIKLAP